MMKLEPAPLTDELLHRSQMIATWERLLARIDVTKFPMPCEFKLTRSGVDFRMHVKCVDTGKPIIQHTMLHYDECLRPEEVEAHGAYLLCRLVQNALEHEIDECFRIDGKPYRKPHPEETVKPTR